MGEIRRSSIGNQATEQGEFDKGADVYGMNVSTLPQSRPDPIDVDVEPMGNDLVITPRETSSALSRSLGELEEGAMDLMAAQLLEEPEPPAQTGLAIRQINGIEVQATNNRAMEISRRSPREALVWYGMHQDYYGAMAGDRILVRKDILENEYSCKACHGRGYDDAATCTLCHGEQVERNNDGSSSPCRACQVLGYEREKAWASGRKPCDKCRGTGWRGGIIIPEVAQAESITGIIVSVGPDVKLWKIGDRVVHSKYAGHTLTVSKTDSFVMMRESEVLMILKERSDNGN